jgi:hypothetical protein
MLYSQLWKDAVDIIRAGIRTDSITVTEDMIKSWADNKGIEELTPTQQMDIIHALSYVLSITISE